MTVVVILKTLNISFGELMSVSTERGFTKLFETDWSHSKFFVKQILSGAFITITMTGLDQDMMQKNLTCKTLRDAQKNVMTSSFFFVLVNLLFMSLGAALIYYAQETGFQLPVNESGVVVNDKIFPAVAFSLNKFTSIVFIIGLIAAGYSSADGTLTALTTTFCFDFLHFDTNDKISEENKVKYRKLIHIAFALLYLLVIILFRPFHNESLIDKIFEIAGYTYGPLLGLYSFGLFVKNRKPIDKLVPIIAISSPIISYVLNLFSKELFFGYQFGFEILIVNGLLTFTALLLFSKKQIVK
jgi:Na+/proline symporter